MADLDDIDIALIELLQKDARTPQAQLAAEVGLAASSVNERIRKLGERGLIAGYHHIVAAVGALNVDAAICFDGFGKCMQVVGQLRYAFGALRPLEGSKG